MVKPTYSIVIPVFNSSSTLTELVEQIHNAINPLDKSFEIILVDDCSPDNSWNVMLELKKLYPVLTLIRLGNNFGQFAATFCGVEHAKADTVITIDDDLQYPPSEIPKLISYFENNNRLLVYGVPKNRKTNVKSKIYAFLMQLLVYLTVFKFYMPKGFYYTGFRVLNKDKLWRDDLNGMGQHFDIFALWHLHPKYIGFTYVYYQQRKKGKSGQTFRKKSNDAIMNLMCTFRSPLKIMYNLSLILLVLTLVSLTNIFVPIYKSIPKEIITSGFILLFAIAFLNFFVIGLYLGRIFSMKRGYKDYFVIEKL